VWPLRGCRTTKMLGSRTMTNYSCHDSCGRCWGEIVATSDAGQATNEVQHHWSRGHGAGEGSAGRDRARVDRRRCWYWERTGTCQRGTGCPGSHSYQQPSAQDAGPAAKKPRGKMVKNTEILGEFRRTLSRFSAAN
jgi:hypothetical protein